MNWSKKRIKDILLLRNTSTANSSLPYIGLENIESWTAKYISSNAISEGHNSCFCKGDILFSKLRPYLAKGYIAECDGVCSTEFLVLKAFPEYNSRFLLYWLLSFSTIDFLANQVSGVKMPRIKWETLANVSVLIPTKTEQDKIVEFLDKKNCFIDRQITIFEKSLILYSQLKLSYIDKYTSNGIDNFIYKHNSYIVKIKGPSSLWERHRIKDIGFIFGGLSGKSGEDFRSEDNSRRKPYIPFTNILNNTYIDESQYNYVVMKDGESQNVVKKNDLLFLMSSEDYESIAKTAVVKNDIGEVYLNSFCKGVRFYNENLVYAPFVNYQLSSTKFRDYLRFEARGFTRINIKVDKINSMFVYLPPLEEQKAIVAYLDDKCAKIDAIVSNINSQIEKLQLLKKSLINEVISGRRKV